MTYIQKSTNTIFSLFYISILKVLKLLNTFFPILILNYHICSKDTTLQKWIHEYLSIDDYPLLLINIFFSYILSSATLRLGTFECVHLILIVQKISNGFRICWIKTKKNWYAWSKCTHTYGLWLAMSRWVCFAHGNIEVYIICSIYIATHLPLSPSIILFYLSLRPLYYIIIYLFL